MGWKKLVNQMILWTQNLLEIKIFCGDTTGTSGLWKILL